MPGQFDDSVEVVLSGNSRLGDRQYEVCSTYGGDYGTADAGRAIGDYQVFVLLGHDSLCLFADQTDELAAVFLCNAEPGVHHRTEPGVRYKPLAVDGIFEVYGIDRTEMDTDTTAQLRADPERNKAILERIPAGRWGKPEDLQGLAVFLASDASSYLNGFTIAADGGWLAR